jgi:uncharacterized protein (TIGR02118 family)
VDPGSFFKTSKKNFRIDSVRIFKTITLIKLSVLFPYDQGKSFDMPYYYDKHIPLLKQLIGSRCLTMSVEQGIADAVPGTKAVYVVMNHFYFRTLSDFHSSFSPHASIIMSDIINFTDSHPVIQISEVKI